MARTYLPKDHADAVAVVAGPSSFVTYSSEDLVPLELRFLHVVDCVAELNAIGVEVEDLLVVVVLNVHLQHYARVSGALAPWADGRVAAVHVAERVKVTVWSNPVALSFRTD